MVLPTTDLKKVEEYAKPIMGETMPPLPHHSKCNFGCADVVIAPLQQNITIQYMQVKLVHTFNAQNYLPPMHPSFYADMLTRYSSLSYTGFNK